MLFNSFDFLIFFSIFFILYYYSKSTTRRVFLLIASCIFYMWFIPAYVLILFLTILIDYYAGIKIENATDKKHKKLHLILGIVNTCMVLFVFKYHNFVIDNLNFAMSSDISPWNIILPIGLSFHVFQSLSYVIEVYRGNIKAERNLLIYSNFVMMFPQLVAGPIERANNMLPQLNVPNYKIKFEDFSIGLTRFFWGLFKKVAVADTIATYVNATYGNYEHHSGITLAVSTMLFAFQIYCDFSGYSDMAIGIARMIGFKFKENFAIPYFSKTITEFWRRWHISLSTWLRDYLYISFGGNRKGKIKQYRNLMLTMLIGGLWHGASWNFVIWGALCGIYLSIEKLFNIPKIKPKNILTKSLGALYVFILISFTWIFFRAETFEKAIGIIKKIFSEFNPFQFNFLDINVFATIILSIITLLIFEYNVMRKYSFERIYNMKRGLLFSASLIIFCLLFIIIFGNTNGSSFIYFQF